MWIAVQIRGIDGVVGDGERALDLALNKRLTRIVRVCAMAVNLWLSRSNRSGDPFGF
jgi:hypothetical protein